MTGSNVTVEFLQLPHGRGLPRPAYQTLEAAGMVFVEPTPEDMAQATATSAAIQDDLIRNLDISPEIVAMAQEALQ